MSTAQNPFTKVQISVADDGSEIVQIGDAAKVKVSAQGNVIVFTEAAVQTKNAAVKDKQLRLGADFLAVSGVKVELKDNAIVVSTAGKVTLKPVDADDSVAVPGDVAQVKQAETKVETKKEAPKQQQPTSRQDLKVGEADNDGWIYAGVSPDTGKAMFVAPQDTTNVNLAEAQAQAEALQEQGKPEARVPSLAELKVIFNNRAEIGGFKTATKGVQMATYLYRSSTPVQGTYANKFVQVVNFSSGKEQGYGKVSKSYPVRLVRS